MQCEDRREPGPDGAEMRNAGWQDRSPSRSARFRKIERAADQPVADGPQSDLRDDAGLKRGQRLRQRFLDLLGAALQLLGGEGRTGANGNQPGLFRLDRLIGALPKHRMVLAQLIERILAVKMRFHISISPSGDLPRRGGRTISSSELLIDPRSDRRLTRGR